MLSQSDKSIVKILMTVLASFVQERSYYVMSKVSVPTMQAVGSQFCLVMSICSTE